MSRRQFITLAAETGVGLAAAPALGQGRADGPLSATAITEVFGDGARMIAVALAYATPVAGAGLDPGSFRVEGRTVTGAFPSASADPADRAAAGRFVIVTVSPADAAAPLVRRSRPLDGGPGQDGRKPGGPGGPGKAGDVPSADTTYPPPSATVAQVGPVPAASGGTVPAAPALRTTAVANLVVDDFFQREFRNPVSGALLRYNLFVPKDHDPARTYPLVLFMHDAGATGPGPRTTLFQGLGAIAWASPADQAERPCFVLAPQYAEIIADDESHTSGALPTTVRLIEALGRQYPIDPARIYATGQSGGCMMAIAMMIAHPDLFAAAFLVAGQWDPALVAPLAGKRLWILVSQDDDKAFPGENAITAELERHGATVGRAVWDGRWSAADFSAAYDKLAAERRAINYVTFAKGTVVPAGQSPAGASGHRNTWRIAYSIAPIRAWLFERG